MAKRLVTWHIYIFAVFTRLGSVLNGALDTVVGYVRFEHAQRVGETFTIGEHHLSVIIEVNFNMLAGSPKTEGSWRLVQPPWLVDVLEQKAEFVEQ